jgi:hypothetical protein
VQHYSAVMKYISQGPMLLDVHMHRPHTNSRNFMDALLAFWPGLQVQKWFIIYSFVHGLKDCYKHKMLQHILVMKINENVLVLGQYIFMHSIFA